METQSVVPSVEDALRDQIARLQGSLSDTMRTGKKAVEMIGEALIEEAQRRGWCSEYDDFVEKLNDRLPLGYELPTREREFEVTLTYRVEFRMKVNAVDEDSARDTAVEEFDEGSIGHDYADVEGSRLIESSASLA